MTLEEWLESWAKKHGEDLEGEDLDLAKAAWGGGYLACMDDKSRKA